MSVQRGPATSSLEYNAPRLQDAVYGEGYEYRHDSPHLKHRRLYERLLAVLRTTVGGLEHRGLPLDVLEIGGGGGAFTEPLLAFGCRVTVTEISAPAAQRLKTLYGRNQALDVVFDRDGSTDAVGERRFSLIFFGSVLHHIPDYLVALDHVVSTRLASGGSLVSVQDPLWYPSLPRGVHAFSELSFLTWRLGQGNLLRGVRSRIRRMRGQYEVDNPSDMVEYHVVRQGVDEKAVETLLLSRFQTVTLIPYWSTFAAPLQRLGEAFNLRNTFAVTADGHRHKPLG